MLFTYRVLSLVQFLNALKAISSIRLFCKYLKEEDKTYKKVSYSTTLRLLKMTCFYITEFQFKPKIIVSLKILTGIRFKTLNHQEFRPPVSPGVGESGGTSMQKVRDTRRLAWGCKSWILVTLRVFRVERHCFRHLKVSVIGIF